MTTPAESIQNALRHHQDGARIKSWTAIAPSNPCGCQTCARWSVVLTDGQEITLTGYQEARAFCHGLASAEQATRPVLGGPQQNLTYGYTTEQLSAAFDRVKNPANWKLPLKAWLTVDVTEADRKVIDAAITFYTGSIPEWEEQAGGCWTVTAAGYYAAIGA